MMLYLSFLVLPALPKLVTRDRQQMHDRASLIRHNRCKMETSRSKGRVTISVSTFEGTRSPGTRPFAARALVQSDKDNIPVRHIVDRRFELRVRRNKERNGQAVEARRNSPPGRRSVLRPGDHSLQLSRRLHNH